uniref:Uncharacterized protein n=1 Tax=viral metagenome TaxID=1070528 RepID=A0A6M3L924_9ZZZZ
MFIKESVGSINNSGFANCCFCNKGPFSMRSLRNHLRVHSVVAYDYYNKFYKKDSEGLCLNCSKEVKRGLIWCAEFCSHKCANSYHGKQPEFRKSVSDGVIKKWTTVEYREKVLKYSTSEEKKQYLSKKFKGRKNKWFSEMNKRNAGKTYEQIYGKEKAAEIRTKKHSNMDSTVSKILSKVCQRPNNFERKCGVYLEQNFPGKFVYCGNGSIVINGKSPDYISNELKTVVLCNGLYWHLKRANLSDTSEIRKSIELVESFPFNKGGYAVRFIWEDFDIFKLS